MDEVVREVPIGIAVKFAGRDAPDADVTHDAEFGGKFGDIANVFAISPKIYLGARLFI